MYTHGTSGETPKVGAEQSIRITARDNYIYGGKGIYGCGVLYLTGIIGHT